MARVTPEQAQEKHARRLKQAQPDISAGVDRVSEAPTKAAAAKIDKMRAKLLEAIDSGKVQRGLNRVTLEEWKSMMKNKGIPRIAEGIDRAADKVRAFFDELLPYEDNLQKKVKGMPDVTLEDSIQRMSEWARGMANFKRG